jgi:hypothetical protein
MGEVEQDFVVVQRQAVQLEQLAAEAASQGRVGAEKLGPGPNLGCFT